MLTLATTITTTSWQSHRETLRLLKVSNRTEILLDRQEPGTHYNLHSNTGKLLMELKCVLNVHREDYVEG